VIGAPDAAATTALGLHALQHRGQEAAGITSFDGKEFHTHRGLGHVAGNFDKPAVIAELPGRDGRGHNRYSTTGGRACATSSRCMPNWPAAALRWRTTAISPTR
jgi:amidophosphoribosyltransferase